MKRQNIRKISNDSWAIIRMVVAALTWAFAGAIANAQILIGQTVGVTGSVAATVKEGNLGAALYIDAVNAKGGIGGQKIEIITLDDKFDVKLAAQNTRTLIEKRQVIAMIMSRGTPHTQEMIPILNQFGVPLIGPSTGAMVLHEPLQKYVFNVRAPYQAEAEKVITYLASLGTTRIGIIHVDDTFGEDGLQGAKKGLEIAKLQAAAIAKFDRSKPDYTLIVPTMLKADPQSILMIGSGTAVVDGVKALRSAGVKAQLITLSNNASNGFIKLLGDQARGVIVAQVLPQSYSYPIVIELIAAAKAKGIGEVSPAMLEGYATAKVLVEGLRRCGGKPTREKLLTALENIRKFDLGGLEISYSATNHTGLKFSDLSIINASGKFGR